ncbi:protein argonaute 1A-like [Carex rostrata]
MSSYQSGRGAQGRGYQGGHGGRGRGGGGGGGPHHGGSQYDNTENPAHRQHPEARGRGRGQYPGPNSRPQYLEPRGQPGNYMGPTPRGPSHQKEYAPPQKVKAPHAEYPAPAQQQQTHGPYYCTVPDLHQANQPRQPAVIPQVIPEATGGGVVQEPADADRLEEQMSELAIQPGTPSSLKFPRKPGKGTCGEKTPVRVNHFLVQLTKKELQLHHYDVKITPIVTSCNRSVMQALVRKYRHSHLNGRWPVYDGRSNLFTAAPLPFVSQSFTVTLPDENRHREGRDFKVEISLVSCLNMRDLEMFLAGLQPNAPLDVIQALEIVLRECLLNRQET